jgi:hypothetical protein
MTRPNDLVGVGGAVCVAPEACGRCGRPATHFEGVGRSAQARVVGTCDACAEYRAALAAWEGSLPEDAREDWEALGTPLNDDVNRRYAPGGVDSWEAARREFRRVHDAPADPAEAR